MTKENPPAIDPRYDPVYQRGFAGTAAHARIRAVGPPKEERPAPPQRLDPARPPVLRTSSDERVAPFVVPPASSSPQDEPIVAESAAAGRVEPAAPPGVVLRGNPWLAALWVVGVVLITAGFFSAWRSQLIFVSATPYDDVNQIVTMEVLDLLAPPLLLAGLLVIGGVLFLHAISWRARRVEEEPEADGEPTGQVIQR